MNWFLLFQAIFQIGTEAAKAIAEAIAAGKDPVVIHQTITDHIAALPAKIRE